MQKIRLWGAIHVDLSAEKPSIMSEFSYFRENHTNTHHNLRGYVSIKKIEKKKRKNNLKIDIWKLSFENEWREMLGYSSELIIIPKIRFLHVYFLINYGRSKQF